METDNKIGSDVVVLDFDCTLASRHMYNSIRKLVFREQLPKPTNITTWDDQSKQLLSKLATLNEEVTKLKSDEEKLAKSVTLFGKPCFSSDIKGAQSFSDWIMGGKERIITVQTLLNCATNQTKATNTDQTKAINTDVTVKIKKIKTFLKTET